MKTHIIANVTITMGDCRKILQKGQELETIEGPERRWWWDL